LIKFSNFPELTTEHLLLREIKVEDAPLIHELRSDEATNALIDRKNSTGIGDALEHIDRIKNNVAKNESFYWIICELPPTANSRLSTNLIGSICYWNFNPAEETAEVGYELLPKYRGRGIMSEVLPRVIQFGFEEMRLKFITAFPSEQNTGSVRLLEKFGFKLSSANYENTHEQVPGMMTFVLNNPLIVGR
jgi:[ribosomal protein S5]-alanine N-acetyltransferase